MQCKEKLSVKQASNDMAQHSEDEKSSTRTKPTTSNDFLLEELRQLRPFASGHNLAYIDAALEHGTLRKASLALGLGEKAVSHAIRRLRRRAALQGHSPQHDMTHTVPEPFAVKRVSTLRDGEGNVRAQWTIAAPELEAMAELQREFVRELSDTVVPRKGVSRAPKRSNADIMVGYPLGDHHFGMLSWANETGNDYDSKIAKELLTAAVDYLVSTAPPAEEALFCNLGDLLHMDNRTNRTPQSGHILDVDSRYAKIIRIAAYGIAYAVERLLQKHQRVKLVNVAGNHDMDSASWVSLVLEAYFRNEPRVTVETSAAKFLFHQFGRNMICMTHGDTVKLAELAGVMASYQPVMWGESTYRVAWTGHVHHSQRYDAKDHRGAKVESFGVLPPTDAFAAAHGYHAQREMHAITFKRAGGELGRQTFNVE